MTKLLSGQDIQCAFAERLCRCALREEHRFFVMTGLDLAIHLL
jgi:hypothetical protein